MQIPFPNSIYIGLDAVLTQISDVAKIHRVRLAEKRAQPLQIPHPVNLVQIVVESHDVPRVKLLYPFQICTDPVEVASLELTVEGVGHDLLTLTSGGRVVTANTLRGIRGHWLLQFAAALSVKVGIVGHDVVLKVFDRDLGLLEIDLDLWPEKVVLRGDREPFSRPRGCCDRCEK